MPASDSSVKTLTDSSLKGGICWKRCSLSARPVPAAVQAGAWSGEKT